MIQFVVGMLVVVTANTESNHPPDRREYPWDGRIVYVTESSVGVEPLDGSLPRDVLKCRVHHMPERN